MKFQWTWVLLVLKLKVYFCSNDKFRTSNEFRESNNKFREIVYYMETNDNFIITSDKLHGNKMV